MGRLFDQVGKRGIGQAVALNIVQVAAESEEGADERRVFLGVGARSLIAFHHIDHVAERDLRGRTRQALTAGSASRADDE